MFLEKHYQIDGLRIATLELGNESAQQCAVFLHGWLDNAASFKSLLTICHNARPDWRWVAIDLPGHGFSDHKASPNFYAFHDYIDDIYQILPKISANKPLLIGHSLGALIASCYSAAFPENVAGLVQIEGHAPIAESASLSIDRLRQGVLTRQRQRRKPQRTFNHLNEAIKLRASVNAIADDLIAPIVERGVKVVEQGNGTRYQWRHDLALQCDSLFRMTSEQSQHILSHIQCPHLVILAEYGFAHIAKHYQKMANEKTQLANVAGGHHCHLQYPDQVSELILGLVNSI